MIAAVAFDFDGVLVESTDVKTRAYAKLFKKEKKELKEKIIFFHLKNEGVSRYAKFRTIYRDILKRPLPDKDFDSLCQRFSRLVMDDVVTAPWVAGAEEFLQENRRKIDFFIVSGTPQEELREIVRRRGYEKFFNEILGSPTAKDVLLESLIRKYGLRPGEIIFVGDAETDWIAARKTGVHFVWRRVSGSIPMLNGFDGPCISSLKHLKGIIEH